MPTGCECFVGKNGSTCWHQNCSWSKGFTSSFHFLQRFDTFQQKRFAEIAVGKSLESSFHKPLHLKKKKKKMQHMKRKLVQQIQSEFSDWNYWCKTDKHCTDTWWIPSHDDFLGSIGTLTKRSGILEAFQTVDGKNAVEHMSGKAVKRTIRGQFLQPCSPNL